jgi:hypothetical protein
VRLALNAFADLTWDEFKRTRLGYRARGVGSANANANNAIAKPPSAKLPGFMHGGRAPPASVDWRARGAVSPVGNQGACGSCYAWSAAGAIEGANALATGKTPPEALSVQEVVDCDTAGEDAGCGGGLMDNVFDFVAANGGLDTASEYAYYSSWGLPLSWCNRRKLADRRVVSIDGYQDVPAGDERALMQAASAQPVSVAICASPALQFYSGGVVAERECCDELNHGVLLVGYDADGAWTVKNSWGEGWGEGGYFRLKRAAAAAAGGGGGGGAEGGSKSADGRDAPKSAPGLCGITDAASYPVKKTAENPRVPSACDMFAWAECPYAQTCGCNWRLPIFGGIFPLCIRHDCCPHPRGVDSCGDGAHCCPGDRPVCDPGRGVCVRDPDEVARRGGGGGGGGGGGEADDGAVPWIDKVPANYSWGWAEEQQQARAAAIAGRRALAPERASLERPSSESTAAAAAAAVAAS